MALFQTTLIATIVQAAKIDLKLTKIDKFMYGAARETLPYSANC